MNIVYKIKRRLASYKVEEITPTEKVLVQLVKTTIADSKTTVTLTGENSAIIYGTSKSIALNGSMLTIMSTNKLINVRVGEPARQELIRYVKKVLQHHLLLFKKEFSNKLENLF